MSLLYPSKCGGAQLIHEFGMLIPTVESMLYEQPRVNRDNEQVGFGLNYLWVTGIAFVLGDIPTPSGLVFALREVLRMKVMLNANAIHVPKRLEILW